MKSLVIGAGQVGTALFDCIKGTHETAIRDIKEGKPINGIQVLHICYPDHDKFVENTQFYMDKYNPALTIVHSSVGIGKTDDLDSHVVYSPVRGRHPKLAKDMKIYQKFLFSENQEDLKIARRYFEECGINCFVCKASPKYGEVLKLLSNIHMGIEIAWRQEVDRIFKSFELNSKYYDFWEESYRLGYFESGDDNLARPSMRPDPIGGHCILPCTEILKKQYESPVLDWILESNEKAKSQKSHKNGYVHA